jgi:hypothetical protein
MVSSVHNCNLLSFVTRHHFVGGYSYHSYTQTLVTSQLFDLQYYWRPTLFISEVIRMSTTWWSNPIKPSLVNKTESLLKWFLGGIGFFRIWKWILKCTKLTLATNISVIPEMSQMVSQPVSQIKIHWRMHLKPHCIRCRHFKVDDVSALEAISKLPVCIVEENVTALATYARTPWLQPGCRDVTRIC